MACTWGKQPFTAQCRIFADLLAVEGNPSRSLAMLGLCKRHPAWSMDLQQEADRNIKGWNLDQETVEAGLAQGAA